MAKLEAKWNTVLNQYFREKKLYCFYELKMAGGERFPFYKIETHQWEGLIATENKGLVWKLSDEDQRQKPCDGISIPPLPSYLILKWSDEFYLIRFKEIIKLRDIGREYVTKTQAQLKAEIVIHIR